MKNHHDHRHVLKEKNISKESVTDQDLEFSLLLPLKLSVHKYPLGSLHVCQDLHVS